MQLPIQIPGPMHKAITKQMKCDPTSSKTMKYFLDWCYAYGKRVEAYQPKNDPVFIKMWGQINEHIKKNGHLLKHLVHKTSIQITEEQYMELKSKGNKQGHGAASEYMRLVRLGMTYKGTQRVFLANITNGLIGTISDTFGSKSSIMALLAGLDTKTLKHKNWPAIRATLLIFSEIDSQLETVEFLANLWPEMDIFPPTGGFGK